MKFKDLNLNKKDEKKIKGVLEFFRKGLIFGILCYAVFLLGLIISTIWQKMF